MHYLVADIARTITLVPGDLLLSGTPAHSRPVEPGDVVRSRSRDSGALTNHIVEGPTPVRDDVGAQPTESEEVLSTALGGDWEFRGQRRPLRHRPLDAALPPRPPEVPAVSPRVDGGRCRASRTDHFIDGERVASRDTFEDRSPLDWNLKLADVARGGATEADAAVGAARRAFPAWAALTPRASASAYLRPTRRPRSTRTSRASPPSSASTWRCSKRASGCA